MTIRQANYVAALCLAFTGNSWAESYTIDSKHTFPSFEISHLGFSTQRGRFDGTIGKITLKPKGEWGHIEVSIDANSIDTGLPELEAKLKEADFFNTAKFPSINFNSNSVKFVGETPIATEGTLTMLGISKPLRLTIENFHCGIHPISNRKICGADASGLIKRSDFGMTAFVPMIGDEVKLKIQVEAFLE